MQANLRMLRIQQKMDEIFAEKIDVSDIKSDDAIENAYLTRSIAALAIIMRCGIDTDVAAQCITDGYHDMGIDAVYNDTNQKKLILVQSKWRKTVDGSITQEEATTFVQGLKRIINFDFEGCNSKIESKKQDIMNALKDMAYQIEMIFCHTGNQPISTYAERPVNELLCQVNEEDLSELLIFSEFKMQDIYDYLANDQNGADIILDDVLLSNWGTIDAPFKAYYGTIPASAIGEWYRQYGNRLFAKNIRYYKGSTEVNQGIKDVLKTAPEKFFYYNNGIKILCNRITKKAAYSTTRATGLFVLEGVSLVNGAQTAGAIGTVFAEMPDVVSNANVLIQMIDLGGASEDEATQITKLSNTQNRIEGKDFVSLDPQQDRIRMELSFGGIQYLYKAGARLDDPAHQISLEEAIITQACSLADLSIVALAKRNIGALTENIEKPPYKLLFNGGTNSFALYNKVLTLRIVETRLKELELTSSGRNRLVLVHGNRFLLHLVLLKIQGIQGFADQFLTVEYLETVVTSSCTEYWSKTCEAMEQCFPEAYPAHVFKNVGRLKEIMQEIEKHEKNE